MGVCGHYLKLPIIWFAVWGQAMHSSSMQGHLIAGISAQPGINCSGREWQVYTNFFHQLDLLTVWLPHASAQGPVNPVNDLLTQNSDQCTTSDFKWKIESSSPLLGWTKSISLTELPWSVQCSGSQSSSCHWCCSRVLPVLAGLDPWRGQEAEHCCRRLLAPSTQSRVQGAGQWRSLKSVMGRVRYPEKDSTTGQLRRSRGRRSSFVVY